MTRADGQRAKQQAELAEADGQPVGGQPVPAHGGAFNQKQRGKQHQGKTQHAQHHRADFGQREFHKIKADAPQENHRSGNQGVGFV